MSRNYNYRHSRTFPSLSAANTEGATTSVSPGSQDVAEARVVLAVTELGNLHI